MIRWNEQQRALRDGFDRWHDALSASHIELDKEGGFLCQVGVGPRVGIPRLPFDETWGGLGQTSLPRCTYSRAWVTAAATAA